MSVLEKIEEIFRDPEQFSQENVQKLVQETLQFFGDLKLKLQSNDEKVRTEALETASILKLKLEEQAMALCKSIGMDPKSLENYIGNPSHFTSEEWNSIERTKTEMDEFKEGLGISPNLSTIARNKKPKTVKEWIVG